MLDIKEKFDTFLRTYIDKKLDSLVPVLFLLNLQGKPYTLNHHYQFEYLFNFPRPKRTVVKCARQVGKTFSIIASNILTAWLLDYYRTLYILPRYEQTKRISNEMYKPFVDHSGFKKYRVDSNCAEGINYRSFTNGSDTYFSFAFLDVDRVRCISGVSDIKLDESQDLQWQYVPVIEETTSAMIKHGYISYSGTPKTLDNTLTELWKDSSMAEWVTKCDSCNHYNIPTLEHDVLKMIGKTGVICSKCGNSIDCSKGSYVHAVPEKRSSMSGYHIPQIVHPVHYRYPNKWQDVLYKMRVYPQSKFYNEVLGLECDSSMKMITREHLIKACYSGDIPRDPNDLEHATSIRRLYPILVMGVDWGGGGGEDSVSYTSGAVGGIRPGSDVIETVYAFKLSRYLQPMEETNIIKELFVKFNPTFLAHDFGGAGALRETLLLQAGIPEDRLVPYTYILSPSKAVISYNSPDVGFRSSYSIDKTRSLLILCEMLKARKILFPKWETVNTLEIDGSPITLLQDFEHLYQDVIERASGSDLVRIATSAKKSDDFVHATNYMASTVWYSMQKYPNLAEANQLRLTTEDIENISPILVPSIRALADHR